MTAIDPSLPSVDILVCNFNTKHLLGEMVSAVERSLPMPPVRYLVVDNASTDGSVAHIRAEHPNFELVCNHTNVGFGRANNQLLPYIKADYVLLLNTDAFVEPNTLPKTLRYMQDHPNCGVLGVRLLSRDGSLQPCCRYFPTPLNTFLQRTGLGRFMPWVRLPDDMTWDHLGARECDWVPGCYYLVRKEVLDEIGLFDPRFFLYCEEVDHCRRVKAAGWKVVFFGEAAAIHIGGESAKSVGSLENSTRQLSSLQAESEALFYRKHHGRLGLASHLSLTALADGLRALNSILKRRNAIAAAFGGTRALWRAVSATKFGTVPTR